MYEGNELHSSKGDDDCLSNILTSGFAIVIQVLMPVKETQEEI